MLSRWLNGLGSQIWTSWSRKGVELCDDDLLIVEDYVFEDVFAWCCDLVRLSGIEGWSAAQREQACGNAGAISYRERLLI